MRFGDQLGVGSLGEEVLELQEAEGGSLKRDPEAEAAVEEVPSLGEVEEAESLTYFRLCDRGAR